jgi:hypothetical protein
MIRIHRVEKLAFLPVRAVLMTLFAVFLLAPTSAYATCSHLVKSNSDRSHSAQTAVELSGLVLAGDSLAKPVEQIPSTPVRKPCSGAWCTGQPGIPVVPAGVFESPISSWAWSTPICVDRSIDNDFLITDLTIIRPVSQVGFVFHPPRSSSLPT